MLGDNTICSSEELSKLKFTTAVCKEAMRLYPPVPLIARKIQEPLEIHGHAIPKGVDIMVVPWIIHHNAKLWKEPEKFDPDRFENTQHNPFAFVPFSAGPRNCVCYRVSVLHFVDQFSFRLGRTLR